MKPRSRKALPPNSARISQSSVPTNFLKYWVGGLGSARTRSSTQQLSGPAYHQGSQETSRRGMSLIADGRTELSAFSKVSIYANNVKRRLSRFGTMHAGIRKLRRPSFRNVRCLSHLPSCLPRRSNISSALVLREWIYSDINPLSEELAERRRAAIGCAIVGVLIIGTGFLPNRWGICLLALAVALGTWAHLAPSYGGYFAIALGVFAILGAGYWLYEKTSARCRGKGRLLNPSAFSKGSRWHPGGVGPRNEIFTILVLLL